MVFSLTYMSRGNKAITLTVITVMLMLAGSVIFIIGPDNSQSTGEQIPLDVDDILSNITRRPSTAVPTTPMQSPTSLPPLPALPPNFPPSIFAPTSPSPAATPGPTSPIFKTTPVPATLPPATQPPVTPSPIALDLQQYPFATAYECDWNGERLTLTTKTKSSSVVRLCIEAPPLPDTEEPVEVSYLSWFLFERQPYEGQELDEMVQHAVILSKPDPFGLTVMDCNRGAPVCKFATSLRDEFFEVDAFLLGRGELVLQYVTNKQVAGYAPVSIYFLLSSTDIKEPLQLGRRTAPAPKASNHKKQQRRGRRKRKTPLFANHNNPKHQPP